MSSKDRSGKYSRLSLHIVLFLLIISSPFLIILSSFKAISFNLDYYDGQYSKLNVYDNPKFADVNLMDETVRLLVYLDYGSGEIDSDFYTAREKEHLVDVRELFRKALSLRKFFFFGSIILLLFLVRLVPVREQFFKRVSQYLMYGSLLTLAILLLASALFTDFDSFFISFHETLFVSETWVLDPATDNLINMFPQQFFFDIAKDILLAALIVSLIGLAVGLLMHYRPLLSRYYTKFITRKH